MPLSVKPASSSVGSLLRLLFLYAIFCYWLLLAGLVLRDWRESAQNLAHPAIDSRNPAAAPPFLGITVQLEDQSPAQRAMALQRLQDGGFGWVRQRIDWGEIEPRAGHFEWAKTDSLMHSLATTQLAPLIVLDGSPLWARRTVDQPPDAPQIAPPADPQTFANFAAEFAKRYGDQVRYYQLWDEPNIAPHWGKRWIEPVEYAQLLIAASRAIRAADADAVILTAALAPTADRGQLAVDEVYFLQRMIAAGAVPWFDALAIQPFGFGHAPSDSRQSLQRLNFQRAALIRRAMIDAGIGDKPIWAVRFGWNTRPDSPWASVTPETQQRYTQDAIHLARQNWHWLVALGWAIDQPKAAKDDPLWGFAWGNWRFEDQKIGRPEDAPHPPTPPISQPLLLLLTLPLILLRTHSALRTCSASSGQAPHSAPVRQAQGKLRIPHSAFRIPPSILTWAPLLLIYYFATWPPLIGLCWLLAMGLIALNPQVGIYLAAATLPFYFQHKELAWVDQLIKIPPSLAITLCLLPSIMQRMWHFALHQWAEVYRNPPQILFSRVKTTTTHPRTTHYAPRTTIFSPYSGSSSTSCPS